MHQHVCTTMLLHPMMNFNLTKNVIFPMFHEHNNSKLDLFALFQKNQILGSYNSTPLKMNLVLEIRKMVIKEI